MHDSRTYYEILGVGRNATPDEIARQYEDCKREQNPLINEHRTEDAAIELARIEVAYATLRSKRLRAEYDLTLLSGTSFEPRQDHPRNHDPFNLGRLQFEVLQSTDSPELQRNFCEYLAESNAQRHDDAADAQDHQFKKNTKLYDMATTIADDRRIEVTEEKKYAGGKLWQNEIRQFRKKWAEDVLKIDGEFGGNMMAISADHEQAIRDFSHEWKRAFDAASPENKAQVNSIYFDEADGLEQRINRNWTGLEDGLSDRYSELHGTSIVKLHDIMRKHTNLANGEGKGPMGI